MADLCGEDHPEHSGVLCDLPAGHYAEHAARAFIDGSWIEPWGERRTPPPKRSRGRQALDEMGNRAKRSERRGAHQFARNSDPGSAHLAAQMYEPKRGTAKARVLDLLRAHLGQWVDAPAFTAPEVGGFAGTRRLRELREDGWPIETRPKPDDSNTWQHRLAEES